MNPLDTLTFGYYQIEFTWMDRVTVVDRRNNEIVGGFDFFYRLPDLRRQVWKARNEGKQPPASIDFDYLRARALRSAVQYVMDRLKSSNK